jgi:hypothetical protein
LLISSLSCQSDCLCSPHGILLLLVQKKYGEKDTRRCRPCGLPLCCSPVAGRQKLADAQTGLTSWSTTCSAARRHQMGNSMHAHTCPGTRYPDDPVLKIKKAGSFQGSSFFYAFSGLISSQMPLGDSVLSASCGSSFHQSTWKRSPVYH